MDKYDGYSFMTETITDVYSQFIDCIHGIGSKCGVKAERADFAQKPSPRMFNMPEMFRQTFPETISTVRNPRPYIDPRLANYSLTYGFRFEMELRYQSDRDFIEENRHPEWKEYAQAVCALRKKHADLLLEGTYSCDPALAQANPALNHGLFTQGNRQCLVFWNDSDEELPLNLCGRAVHAWETPASQGEGTPEHIAPNSVVVLF